MSENDVKLLSVRRADDDSGWHVRYAIGGVQKAVWVETAGYLDHSELREALSVSFGNSGFHIDVKPATVYVDDVLVEGTITPITEPSSPPRFAELLFSWLAPKKTLHEQLGDLQEIYDLNVTRFGAGRARMLYWTQVLRAVGPGLWRRVKKLGLIGILIDYGRSKIGW